MNNFFYSFSALFNLITALLVSMFVLSKNWKAKANIGFFLFGFSVAFWSYGYFRWQISNTADSALFWCRILTLGSTWITIWYYYFVKHLLELKQPKYRNIFISGVVLACILTIFNLTSGLLVKGIKPAMIFEFWPIPGPLYLPYLIMFIFYAGYATALLWYEYKRGSEYRKRQIRYVFLGTFIGYLGGCTNYPLWYGINILPFGNILVGLYPLLVGYSIIKYRLFEIDTVIHRTILWILTSSSVLVPVGVMLYFTRPWLTTLGWLQLTFVMTGLFYIYLFYYRKMQPRIDHLFRRRKYDYYAVLAEIGQKIGSELDINRVISRLFKELKEILYIKNGLLLVQHPGQLDTSAPPSINVEHSRNIDYIEAGQTGYDADLQKRESLVSLSYDGAFSRWLNEHQKTLEREQVEVDPQYALIKEEASLFFKQSYAELLIPVIMENRVNALLGIGKKENLQPYTLKDIELLEYMGRQIGITIDNAMHHEDIVEKERLAQELKLGREIQIALLPRESPQIPGLIVQGLMQPAKEIGGDYYDFITIPSTHPSPQGGEGKGEGGNLAVVIGDVSGKGVAAGLLMAMAKTAIHTLSQEISSPREILLRTNTILNKHIGGQKFMTLLYLLWQPQLKTITYSSAGHEHILLYKHVSKTIETIQSGGFMLGMLPDIDKFLDEKEIKLEVQDKILLYTDGITEAENKSGDRFGLSRLKDKFRESAGNSAQEIMRIIKEEVYLFIGAYPQYDDITLVVLEAI